MSTTVLCNATILTVDSQDRIFDPGYLVVRNGIIDQVAPGAGPIGDHTLDLTGFM